MEPNLRKQVKELKKTASVKLDSIKDSRLRYNAQGAKNAAEQKLEKLLPQVIEGVLTESRTLVILDNVSKKLDGLDDRKDAIVLDYQGFDKKMVDLIFPKKTTDFGFNTSVQTKLNNLLYEHFVKVVNVQSMPYLTVRGTNFGTIKTREEAVKKIGEWIRMGYDNEMKSILLRHQLSEAVKDKLDFDSLTVIVYNVPPSAAKGFYNMTGRTVILSGTGDEQGSIAINNETSDEEVLKNLKSFFKGDSNEQQQ